MVASSLTHVFERVAGTGLIPMYKHAVRRTKNSLRVCEYNRMPRIRLKSPNASSQSTQSGEAHTKRTMIGERSGSLSESHRSMPWVCFALSSNGSKIFKVLCFALLIMNYRL